MVTAGTPRGLRLLYEYGFLDPEKAPPEIRKESPDKRRKRLKVAGEEHKNDLLGMASAEQMEISDGYITRTDFPASEGYFQLVHEAANISMEEGYFWVLEHARQDRGFFEVIKVTDIYDASHSSAFWGNQQQRISAQQNQAQGLLANIGKFVRELFQMVRELRIIDERLKAYEDWKTSDSADVTLKSIFTDVVEGGTKNPQSVFGLAQTVGFTLLPDLFFNTRVYTLEELDGKIEKMDYNVSVKNVLRRKLYQFIAWKEETHKELINRRKFNVQYLRQHFGIIKLYMGWAKPYLRNVQALQMRDDSRDPELIKSFDTSTTEVEFLAKRPATNGVFPVMVATFQYRTRPDMSVRREYQTGPSHTGRLQMELRSYAWTQEQIDNYLAMRAAEEIEMLGLLDSHLEAIMEEMREDLMHYLHEKQLEVMPEEKKEEEKKPDVLGAVEPFTAVLGGFGELFGALVPLPQRKKGKGAPDLGRAYGKAAGEATLHTFLIFHIYKKAHRMISW